MEIPGKISRSQAAFLTLGSAMSGLVYTIPNTAVLAGRMCWLTTLAGVLIDIPFALWVLVLGTYQKDGTLFDLLEDGLGKAASKFLLILYILINLAISACILNMFAGMIKVYFLPRTPLVVIVFIIVLMSAIFTNGGLLYFARLAVLLCTLAITNYFTGFSLSFVNQFRIEYITPIFDASYLQIARGTYFSAASNADCLLFLMLMVSVTPLNMKYFSSVAKGLFAWAIVISAAVFICEGCLGPELWAHEAQGGLSVSTILQVGSFIGGIEVFLLLTYQYIAFVKTTIYLYSSWTASKKFFNVPKGKPLLILLAVALIIGSGWINSYNKGFYYSIFLGNYVIFPFTILLLLLGTFSVFVKKIRGDHKSK